MRRCGPGRLPAPRATDEASVHVEGRWVFELVEAGGQPSSRCRSAGRRTCCGDERPCHECGVVRACVGQREWWVTVPYQPVGLRRRRGCPTAPARTGRLRPAPPAPGGPDGRSEHVCGSAVRVVAGSECCCCLVWWMAVSRAGLASVTVTSAIQSDRETWLVDVAATPLSRVRVLPPGPMEESVSKVIPLQPRLVGRVHVDLCRRAVSACCSGTAPALSSLALMRLA